GDVGEMRRRAEHAPRRWDDGELHAAEPAEGQELLEQLLVQLAARDDDAISALERVDLLVQQRAAADPAGDLRMDVREELELPLPRLRQRPLPDDQHALRRRDAPPQRASCGAKHGAENENRPPDEQAVVGAEPKSRERSDDDAEER